MCKFKSLPLLIVGSRKGLDAGETVVDTVNMLLPGAGESKDGTRGRARGYISGPQAKAKSLT